MKRCPTCGSAEIERVPGVAGIHAPPFRCKGCGAGLKASFAPAALCAIPACLASGAAAYFGIAWVRSTGLLQGAWLAAFVGGALSLAAALPTRVLLRNMRYRAWSKQGPGAIKKR